MSLLRLDQVTCRFGGLVANDAVSFSLEAGEILGLIGPNGAGKSTLFNIIAGARRASAGRIWFDGTDITGTDAPSCCAAGIARTFQVARSFESMSVLENVTVGAYNRLPSTRAARARAREVIEWSGLAHCVAAPASALTPPERRRLEVARALATEPKLLLLDEVLTGLTPTEAQAGVAFIRSIRDRGITILMVEHVMEILMPLIDRAVVLNFGQVLAEGRPSDIIRHPEVIRAYLGERYAAVG
jgi:branched-chain amino acid transport system ATP-binding protein